MKTTLRDYQKQMKAAVVVCFLALAAFGLTTPAVQAQDPGVSYNPFLVQGIVSPAPLLPVEFNGTGVVAFDVGNTGSTELDLRPGQAMRLVVSLSKGVPNVSNPNDPVAALAALGGDGVEWFDWTYTPSIATFEGIQRMTIPGSTPDFPSRRTITIQYRVTENSFLGASPTVSNGFNVNLTPPPYANPQPTDDDAVSSYTFVRAFDFGDAPISYGAAEHAIDLTKTSGGLYNRYMYLGSVVDPEDAYQASADARGDDNNQTGGLDVDDEEGVTFPATMLQGQTYNIPVTVTLWDWDPENPPATAQLRGWIDWDRSGAFAATTERIVNIDLSVFLEDEPAWTGARSFTVPVSVLVPLAAPDGFYYARFRIGPAFGPIAIAEYGEVEDYQIEIGIPLSVLLVSFTTTAQSDRVVVAWETVSEASNTGFNLYRALEADGERTLLGWIPSAAPGSTQGAGYSSQDFDVTAGQSYWYYLEDIDLNGATTLHGPVSALFLDPTAVRLGDLNANTGQGVAPWMVVLAILTLIAGATILVARKRVTA